MSQLSITKTYQDGVTPTQLDLDNIADSLETFLNVTKLGSDNIAANSITASSTFVEGSITAGKIASSAVTTAKIADSAITSAKIADGAVTTAKIADSNVTTAKIADSAVTSAKVNDGAVTAAKKSLQAGGSVGNGVNSTGAVSTGTALTDTFTRPALFSVGGGANTIYHTSYALIAAAFQVYKDGASVMSQDFFAGPFDYTAGIDTKVIIPSSSTFFIDSTDSTALSRSYNNAVDLIAGSLASSSGGNNAREIV